MKRKYFLVSVVFLLVILLTSCTNSSMTPADKLTIYSVNDFHGAIQENEGKFGISRLGNFIMQAKQENPNEVVVVSAGDMFQGTGISNYNKGLNVIEMMNIIGFDAMTIGNHEFDWGIDTILNYRDGDTKNGEADFPFIAANILYKDNNLIPENIEPYTIIERGGLKIGIIGYIGYGLEDDIATKMIEDYYFALPVNAVEPFVVEMRTEKNCDVVIAVGHDASDVNNQALANLTDDARIDAIVNGHLHLDSSSYVTSIDGRKVPVVQAGSSGEYVGVISFDVDQATKTLSNPLSATVLMDGSKQTNKKLNNYVSDLVKETEPYFGRVLSEAGEKITVSAVRKWAPSVVQKYMNVEIAFVNSGGIRADAFPIAKGEKVDVAKVYQIMPFDNTIKTCMLKGSDVLKVLNNSGIMYSNTITKSGGLVYINGELLDKDKYYSIAAVDYIFDKPENPFLNGENIDNTGILYRDILVEGIEETSQNNEKWFPSK